MLPTAPPRSLGLDQAPAGPLQKSRLGHPPPVIPALHSHKNGGRIPVGRPRWLLLERDLPHADNPKDACSRPQSGETGPQMTRRCQAWR
ncbi:hypothetical protein P7K49_035216 [Saguinus oedipus]|uniref:Uncharacterized protein n=1 Tax=Saguinus oedipus TaxID=9490 RepID=A0ABQ9TX05_SAGOE|nr:hypothetical protein P7K49_035216 [Saguinus oedipus]